MRWKRNSGSFHNDVMLNRISISHILFLLEILCMEKGPVGVQGDILYFRMQMFVVKHM